MAYKPFTLLNSNKRDPSWGVPNDTAGRGVTAWANAEPIINPALTPAIALPEPKPTTSYSEQYIDASTNSAFTKAGTFIADAANVVYRAGIKLINSLAKAPATLVNAVAKGPTFDFEPIKPVNPVVKTEFKPVMTVPKDIIKDRTLYSDIMNTYNAATGNPTRVSNATDNPIISNWKGYSASQDVKVAELDSKVGMGIKIIASTIASIPQNAQYALGYAIGAPWLGAAGTIGQSIEENAPVGSSDKQFAYAALSGGIDAVTEYVFNLWSFLGKAPSGLGIFGTEALSKLGAKVAKSPTVIRAGYELLKSAGGEGAEELIAYPFQQWLEWRMVNPDAPATEYYNLKKLGEWGFAGLAGAVGGALFGSFGMISNMRQDSLNRKIMENKSEAIGNTPVDELTKEKTLEYLDLTAAAVKEGASFNAAETLGNFYEQNKNIDNANIDNGIVTSVDASRSDLPIETANITTNDIKASTQAPTASNTVRNDTGTNVGVHFGDLGKSEHLQQADGSRNTGFYGTGTYFVSTQATSAMTEGKYSNYKDRPKNVVDFSGYNLYTPITDKKALELHELLRQVTKRAMGSRRYLDTPTEMYNSAVSLFGKDAIGDYASFLKKVADLRTYVKTNSALDQKAYFAKTARYDSPSTVFMKSLGYEGVDVRGIKGFDDSQYGSVIYDLKPSTQSQPIANNATTVVKRNPYKESIKSTDINKTVALAIASDPTIIEKVSAEVKTKEDVAVLLAKAKMSLIRDGGKSFMPFLSLRDMQEGVPDNIRVQTDIAILKRLLDRFADVPEGHDIRRVISSMEEIMRMTESPEKQLAWESEVKEDDMIYEVITEKSVVAKAHREYDNKELSPLNFSKIMSELNTTTEISMDSVVGFGMYAKRLINSDNIVNVDLGQQIIARLAKRATTGGQFIKALDFLYNELMPQRMVDKTTKSFDKMVDDVMPDKNGTATQEGKKLNEATKKNRKEALKETVADLDNILTPAIKVKNRIINDIKTANAKAKTAEQKMVDTLYRLYKETNPNAKKEADPFAAIAEMVSKREEYASVWEKAKALVLERGPYEAELADYISRLADPVMTKSIMDKAMGKVFKNSGKSLSEIERKAFLSGNESLDGFFAELNAQMPEEFTDADFAYLKTEFTKRFHQRVFEKQKRLVESYKLSRERQRVIKDGIKTYIDPNEKFAKSIMDLAYKDKLADADTRTIWAIKLGIPQITDAMKQDMYDTAVKLSKTEDRKEIIKLTSELRQRIASTIPSTWKEKYFAWTNTSLLLFPSTILRNVVSNNGIAPLYRMRDSVSNALNKLAPNTVGQGIRDFGKKIIKRGDVALYDDLVKPWLNPEQMAQFAEMYMKYSANDANVADKKVFTNKITEFITKMPMYLLNEGTISKGGKGSPVLGDVGRLQYWFEYAFINRLNALNITEADTKKPNFDALLNDVVINSLKIANTRIFRERTLLSKMVMGLKNRTGNLVDVKALRDAGKIAEAQDLMKQIDAADVLVGTLFRYVNTPIAIATEAYRFSPYNLAISLAKLGYWTGARPQLVKLGVLQEKGVPVDKIKVLHDRIGQGAVGTSTMLILGIVGAVTGLLTGSPPDSEKERLLWAQQGKRAYSIYIPHVGSMSLDWFQPMSQVINMGVAIGNAMTGQEKWKNVVTQPFDALMENAFWSDVISKFKGNSVTLGSFMTGLVADSVLMGMPRVVRAFNRLVDPYERDAYTGDAVNVLKNRFLSYFPLGTFLIPAKVDMWGQEVRQVPEKSVGGLLERTFLNYVSPMIVARTNMDAITDEITRVYNATGRTEALPTPASDVIKYTEKGVSYSYPLSGKEWVDYQAKLGQVQRAYLKLEIDKSSYAKLSDTDKLKKLESAYSKALADTKEAYIAIKKRQAP